MLFINKEKLKDIEKKFNKNNKTVDIKNFLNIMISLFNIKNFEEEIFLKCGFIQLFNDIDINGDKTIDWDEFTIYILDLISNLKLNNKQITDNDDNLLYNGQGDDSANNYEISKYINLLSLNKRPMQKLIFSKIYNKILILEFNSNNILILNYKFIKINVLYFDRLSINCISDWYLSKNEKILLLINEEKKLFIFNFIDLLENNFNYEIIEIYDNFKQFWNIKDNYWLFSNLKNEIKLIYFKKEKNFNSKLNIIYLNKILAHKQYITDIVFIKNLNIFITCSFENSIKIWNFNFKNLNSSKIKYSSELEYPINKIKCGMKKLIYCKKHEGFLISFSHSNKIFVWSLNSSLTHSFIGIYKEHTSFITDVLMAKDIPNVISLDINNIIKIWDINTFKTKQIINITKNTFNYKFVGLLNLNENFFYCYGKKTIKFVNKKYKRNIKFDKDNPPFEIYFNSYNKSIICSSKRSVNIYSIKDGKLKSSIIDNSEDQLNPDISYFSIGVKERKFYLGDINEGVSLFESKNCSLLKRVSSYKEECKDILWIENKNSIKKYLSKKNEITCLLYLNNEKLLIVGTSNSNIKIYDESLDEKNLIKIFCGGHQDSSVRNLYFIQKLSILISGSDNGIICFWNIYSKKKLENAINLNNEKINYIDYLEEFQLIFISTLKNLYLFDFKSSMKLKLKFKLEYNQNITKIKLFCIKGQGLNLNENLETNKYTDYYINNKSKKKKRYYLFSNCRNNFLNIYSLDILLENYNFNEWYINLKNINNIFKTKDIFVIINDLNSYLWDNKNLLNNEQSKLKLDKLKIIDWKVHNNELNDFIWLDDNKHVITIGDEYLLKIWDFNKVCLCLIDNWNKKVKYWNYNYNWYNYHKNNLKNGLKILDTIYNNSITNKDEIIFNFFNENYIKPYNMNKLEFKAIYKSNNIINIINKKIKIDNDIFNFKPIKKIETENKILVKKFDSKSIKYHQKTLDLIRKIKELDKEKFKNSSLNKKSVTKKFNEISKNKKNNIKSIKSEANHEILKNKFYSNEKLRFFSKKDKHLLSNLVKKNEHIKIRNLKFKIKPLNNFKF